MKAGDKVICKVNFEDPFMPFEKGKEYIIEKVETSVCYIRGYDEFSPIPRSPMISPNCFRIESNEDVNPYLYWFKDCFWTEKELRKEKLNEIGSR